MIRVLFGAREATASAGETLLDAGQAAGQPLEGTCGGAMACATCHVLVDPAWSPRLEPASSREEDMLDLVPDATRHSRLACQIVLTAALDGLIVRLP